MHIPPFVVLAFTLLFTAPVSGLEDVITSQPGAPELVFAGVQIDDTFSGNGNGRLEPGESAGLGVVLYNDGNELARSISGTLVLSGNTPGVMLIDKTATWPDITARGVPQLTDAPHFEIGVDPALACGTILEFRLEATTGTGESFDIDFSLRAGRTIDYDMLHDAPRRYNEQESSIWGADAGDSLGWAFAWGDINGDGFQDLVLGIDGSDSYNNSRLDGGEVLLLYGGATRWGDIDLQTPPFGTVTFWGAEAGDRFGGSVATGDVNGDGYDDIIVGAYWGDSVGNARYTAGEVYLIYGKASPWASTDVAIGSPDITRIDGVDDTDLLGVYVSAGDVDGDGFDDLLLGAWGSDSVGNSRGSAGEVYLLYGRSTHWPDVDLSSPPAGVVTFWGANAYDSLGSSVATGDINGDGYDDLLLGAWEGDGPTEARSRAGEVYVIHGKPGQWTDTDLASPPAGVVRFWGADTYDMFGVDLAAGDVNDDGFDDLIVGAYGSDSAGNNRSLGGEAYLIYGKAGMWMDTDMFNPPAGVVRFWGAATDGELGIDVSAGDVDGDGYDDVILGAWDGQSVGGGRAGAGEVHVVHGRAASLEDLDLARPNPRVTSFWGAEAGDDFGGAFAVGDADGDGYDDLVIGNWLGDSLGNGRSDAGEADVWYGKPTHTYYPREEVAPFLDASVGSPLDLVCDDCSIEVPIGFTFPFYGESHSSLYVSSNGMVSFLPIHDLASAGPICMPARNPDNFLIAPFWDDLNPTAGGPGSGVFTLLEGVEPDRRLTIEWKDIPHYPDIGAVTFEMTLFEATGQILFQYDDLDFGDPGLDSGAAAVVGVENRAGAHGVAWSCFDATPLAGGVDVRMVPTTPLMETGAEMGEGLWLAGGPWFVNDGWGCGRDAHSGSSSWHFGQSVGCNYDLGYNIGHLYAPTVPDFPADARLTYWNRRQTEPDPNKDLSFVEISTTGTSGSYAPIRQEVDRSGLWKYGGVTNLFANPGDTLDLRFTFDTVDALDNDWLGWMIDDLQLVGCNAQGAPAVARASAYAQPTAYCVGETGQVDAVGSYCGSGEAPTGWQWSENGGPIPGATEMAYSIPGSHPPGTFDYTVSMVCPGGPPAESPPAMVSIVPPPEAVGPTLALETASAGSELVFTWSDVGSASDYLVVEDIVPDGSFTQITGVASSGATGLTVPMPSGGLLYYLAVGRNPVCGRGPLR